MIAYWWNTHLPLQKHPYLYFWLWLKHLFYHYPSIFSKTFSSVQILHNPRVLCTIFTQALLLLDYYWTGLLLLDYVTVSSNPMIFAILCIFSRPKFFDHQTLFRGRTATLIPRKTFPELVAGILGLCIVTESKFSILIITLVLFSRVRNLLF